MKQYTFKDGFKCVASSTEEAKAKHRVMAAKKDDLSKLKNGLKSFGKFFKGYAKNTLLRLRGNSYFKVIGTNYEGDIVSDKYGIWIDIIEGTNTNKPYYYIEAEICLYKEHGVNSKIDYESDELYSIEDVIKEVKNKINEFEGICKVANNLFDLEDKFAGD